MGQQLAAVNRRLHGNNASMDALVTGMQTTEMAATAAGIVTGAGALVVAAKTTGRWAVVKLVAAGAGAIAADWAADTGLRAAGASDQTIRGVRLAAAAITLILLHRVAKRAASQEPKPKPSGTTGQTPLGEPSPPVSPPTDAPTGPAPSKDVAPLAPITEPPEGARSTSPTLPTPSVPAPRSAGIQANKAAGDAVRDQIAAREAPARSEQVLSTVGGVRRVDVLKIGDELVAIESKVERTALDSRVRQELARDWWLRRQGQVDRVIWEFTPSQTTGASGPTAPLLEMLQTLGFGVRINP